MANIRKAMLVALVVGICYGQPGSFEVQLPTNIPSETFVIRYELTGPFGGYLDRTRPQAGRHSYVIETSLRGRLATHIKGILYAPGCALSTFTAALTSDGERSHKFVCQALSTVPLTGKLPPSETLRGKTIEIRVNYVAYWAADFFAIRDGMVTTIPVGTTRPDASGQFRVPLPDFSNDPLLIAPNHQGVFQIWAFDQASGNLLAELVPIGSKVRFGSLKIEAAYGAEMAFGSCAVPSALQKHDGFAVRPPVDECDR